MIGQFLLNPDQFWPLANLGHPDQIWTTKSDLLGPLFDPDQNFRYRAKLFPITCHQILAGGAGLGKRISDK